MEGMTTYNMIDDYAYAKVYIPCIPCILCLSMQVNLQVHYPGSTSHGLVAANSSR